MYMKKEWVRVILFVSVSFALLVSEFAYLLFGGNGLYNSKIYSYGLVQTAVILLSYSFPIVIVAAVNRLLEGKSNYRRKLKNIFILIGVVVASAMIYITTIWKTDNSVEGTFAIVYCTWIIICGIVLTAYYILQSKKFKLRN